MTNEKVVELTKKLEAGIDDVFESGKWQEYLNTMSKFHMYSFGNIMLIMLQNPEASRVAGFQTWKKVGRYVRKGEKAISILAPCPHKRKVEVQTEDGLEEQDVVYTTFRTVPVFDIAQTEGKELPEIATTLTGDVADFDKLFNRIVEVAGIPVDVQEIAGGAHGFFSPVENRIAIQAGMSQAQTIKTLVHETTHSILHKAGGVEENADRDTKEVEAESVAYVVCNALGIDSGDYSFGYVAGWGSGRDKKELKQSMTIIQKTANELIKKISEKDSKIPIDK